MNKKANISKPELSIILPMYNEAACVNGFFERVLPILDDQGLTYEFICINDGSSDNTLEVLLDLQKSIGAIKIIDLSKNFGKEIALTAGIDHCQGDAVIPMDVDLQDPPEVIPKLLKKWKEGFEVVHAVRKKRDSDSFAKRTTAKLFYRIFNSLTNENIPYNAGDFRLMSYKTICALRQLPEKTRFMKGLFNWVGFKSTYIEYDREQRVAGKTKWNYWKLWNFALEGIISFSSIPLQVWSYIGAIISIISFGYASFLIISVLIFGRDIPGYASLMVAILLLGGIQLISLGVIGEYIARIFQEVKHRPLYIINEKYSIDEKDSDGNKNIQ